MSQLRIVKIGKTGVGKSSLGNTLLGKKVFKSSSRGKSVTRMCQSDEGTIDNRLLSIVDTPGFKDTDSENQDEIIKEIKRCMFFSAPGPHAFCFVVQIGRFTLEGMDTMKEFVKHFGDALYNYVIVVFTRYDDYQRECEEDEIECDIQNYVSTLPPVIKDFVMEKCGSRVIGFDNTLKGEKAKLQVNELIKMIDKMLLQNENKYYSNEYLQKADDIIEFNMKKKKMQIEKEITEELEKRQKEIEREADKKKSLLMKHEMLAWKEEMKEKLKEENLRSNVQKSSTAFETFENIVSIVACVVPVVTPIVKYGIKKIIETKGK